MVKEKDVRCPFCNNGDLKANLCSCGAEFKRACGYRYDKSIINSYYGYDQFIEKISKQTGISEDVLTLYTAAGGKIDEVIDGAKDVYRKGDNYPVFFTEKEIAIKKDIPNSDRNVLYFFQLEDEDNIDCYLYYDNYNNKTETFFKIDDGSNIVLKPEIKYYGDRDFEVFTALEIKIRIPYCSDLLDFYLQKYNIKYDENDDFDTLRSEIDEWLRTYYCQDKINLGYDDGEEFFEKELELGEHVESYDEFKEFINKKINEFKKEVALIKKEAIDNFDKFKEEYKY